MNRGGSDGSHGSPKSISTIESELNDLTKRLETKQEQSFIYKFYNKKILNIGSIKIYSFNIYFVYKKFILNFFIFLKRAEKILI